MRHAARMIAAMFPELAASPNQSQKPNSPYKKEVGRRFEPCTAHGGTAFTMAAS